MVLRSILFLVCREGLFAVMLHLARRRMASQAVAFSPLGDRVLVQRVKPAEKTIGGAWAVRGLCGARAAFTGHFPGFRVWSRRL